MPSKRRVAPLLAPKEKYRFKPRWWQVGLSVLAIFLLPMGLATLLF